MKKYFFNLCLILVTIPMLVACNKIAETVIATPAIYTVTYNGNGYTGGSVPTDNHLYATSTTVNILGNTGRLTRTGYTFVGWSTVSNGTHTAYVVGSSLMIGDANITLYAQWTTNPTHTITYNGNGNTSGAVPSDNNSYENSATVTVASNTGKLARTDYTFVGWNTASDGSGTDYGDSATLTMSGANIVLYAKWRANVWKYLGSAGFSAGTIKGSKIVVDSNGLPYVIFLDEGNGNKATIMKYTGSAWENVGSPWFSVASDLHYSLALDSHNIPYVLYRDNGLGSKATVMKYNGTAWEEVGAAGFSAGKVIACSLAFDSNDLPYVCFTDAGNLNIVTAMKYNGTGWENISSNGFAVKTAAICDIKLDSHNTPYIACTYAYGLPRLTFAVMKYNGTAWENVGSAGFSTAGLTHLGFALDSQNTPYLLYKDTRPPVIGRKATLLKSNGGTLENVGPALFSAGEIGMNGGLVIDSHDTPYVVYQDVANNKKATVMKYNGTAWESVGPAGFSAGETDYTDIAINASTNKLYVVYRDAANSNKASVMTFE